MDDDIGSDHKTEQEETSPFPYRAGRVTSTGKPWKRRGRAVFSDLPLALERVTARSLQVMERVLKLPLDAKNGPLLRTQITAAIGAVNAQLKADEARLRAKVQGDVLEKLLQAIAKEKRKRMGRDQEGSEQVEEASPIGDADICSPVSLPAVEED